MSKLRYLKNVVTLKLEAKKCIGCGMCTTVCPHAVFQIKQKKAEITDKDACMECGACAHNCPADAINLVSGVGCAYAVLKGILTGTEPSCDCSGQSGKSCCG